jgi:hypothetical protein
MPAGSFTADTTATRAAAWPQTARRADGILHLPGA